MKITLKLFLLFIFILFIACEEKEDEPDDLVRNGKPQNNNCSQRIPCLPAPTNATAISFEKAIELINKIDRQPKIGYQIKHKIKEKQIYMYDVNGQVNSTFCTVEYNRTRTLTRHDSDFIYVTQKIDGIHVFPNSKECRDFMNNQDNYPRSVALVEKIPQEIKISDPDVQGLKDFYFATFTDKHRRFLHISGAINSTMDMQDENGDVVTINVKTGIDSRNLIDDNFFFSTYYNSVIVTIEGIDPIYIEESYLSSNRNANINEDKLNQQLFEDAKSMINIEESDKVKTFNIFYLKRKLFN